MFEVDDRAMKEHLQPRHVHGTETWAGQAKAMKHGGMTWRKGRPKDS